MTAYDPTTRPRAGEPEPVGAGCFWLRSRSRLKNPGAGAAWKKSQAQEPVGAGCFWLLGPEPEPEPLEKKPGAGAAWEKNQEPEPELVEKKVRSRSRSRSR